jgi:ParB/RepB/Spo0J family partition protein
MSAAAPPASDVRGAAPVMDARVMLDVDAIDEAADNPRGKDVGNIDALAASIAQVGVLQPVTVTPRGKRFLLVYGHRRLAATRQAGLATIPVIVQPMSEAERITRQTIENLHREDLKPLQEATAIANLRDTVAAERDGTAPGQRELARMLGVSQSHVSKRLELLELPAEVQVLLDSGGITLGQAQDLHRLVKVNRAKQAVALAKLHADRNRQQADGGYVYGPTLHQQVNAEVKEAQAQARAARARADLKAAGVRVLKEPQGGWWNAAAAVLTQDHTCLWLSNRLDLTVDDHANAHPDGHAAAVCKEHGQAIWVCADPKAHADTHPRAADAAADHEQASAKEQARREEERQLAAAARSRQAFATQLLTAPVKVPAAARELLDGITAVAIERLESDAAKLVCALLGLEPVIEPPTLQGGGRRKNYRAALCRRAAEDLGRVALAVSLGEGEFRARWTYASWRNPMVLGYLDRLLAAGYQPSPVEQQRLADARKPQQPAPQASSGTCACGEEIDVHEGGVGACQADDCGCPGFRPEEWTDAAATRQPEASA